MEDLIKRGDAIKAVDEAFDLGDCYCDRYGIKGAIQCIPSAEPKQGEWLFVGNSIEAEWECSECGEKEFGSKSSLTNFCPNCGTDMRKGAGDENNQRMD